jgi:hypothetical protein
MFKKDKKTNRLGQLFPPKQTSNKKRNALIGVVGAVATVAISGAAAKRRDSQ